jgi:transposase
MNEIIKQCVGIDISKDTFTVCVCRRDLSGKEYLSETVDFKNLKTGFNQLVKWSRKITDPSIETLFVMEATGIYYENLAHHLHRLNLPVSVLLPNKVKHFAKSLNVKTKTDQVDARIIARLGAERKLLLWKPPPEIFKLLKDLTREYAELIRERTAFKNRLHAMSSGYKPHPAIIRSNKAIIKKLTENAEKIKEEIEKLIYSEEWLGSKVNKVLTAKGVGLMTVATILAEMQGFEFVSNIRQLCSYAGYDVVQRESGTSVKGKTRISKKGNGRIRAALHFPALQSARHSPRMKSIYDKINQNKPSKMVGATAIQRKMLVLIYTLWKKDEEYVEDYENKAGRGLSNLPAQDELPTSSQKLSFVCEI